MLGPAIIAVALGAFPVTVYYLYLWTASRRAVAAPTLSESEPEPAAAPASDVSRAKASPVPVRAVIRSRIDLPQLAYIEDIDEPTLVGPEVHRRTGNQSATQKIVYDDDAACDEPTHSRALILVTATGQTDKGRCRKRNEDSVLARVDHGIFVIADGMGGYSGGEVASQLAVNTIEEAFSTKRFDGPEHEAMPASASELARAIQMANEAIFDKAGTDRDLKGMGTTVCAARFSPNKQRMYIGHVGDSRVYRMRNGSLRQMTADHTMEQLGVKGATATHLSRAVGIGRTVPIDIVLGKPEPGDVYVLCSDGLSKMVDDSRIGHVLRSEPSPTAAVEALIEEANQHGGTDNVSVIVVRVDTPAPRPRLAA